MNLLMRDHFRRKAWILVPLAAFQFFIGVMSVGAPSAKSGYDILTFQIAFFVGAFITGNFSSLRFAMEDRLHQPYRESLIPGMRRVFEAAMDCGAQSVSISGSGPTLIAFVNARDREIGEAMREAWAAEGVESRVLLLEPDTQGHTSSLSLEGEG